MGFANAQPILQNSACPQLPQHPIQLIQILVLDMQRAAVAAVIDRHLQAQRVRQPPLQRAGVGVLGRRWCRRGSSSFASRRAPGARRPRASRPRAGARSSPSSIASRARSARRCGWPTSRRAWPADNWPRAHQRLHRLGQLQQPHHVGDMRPALADDLRHLLLRVIALLHQRDVAGRLLDRIEVGALHVLDDGEFERLHVGRLDDRDRHLVQAGALRRAPAPLAGDDLVVVRRAGCAHHDRLDDAALLDRLGELVEFGLGEIAARVARIGLEIFDRRAARLARRLGRRRVSSPTSPISDARPRPNRE